MERRAKAKELDVGVVGQIQKQGLGQQIVARILELIRTGSLRAGDRLPPERELIQIFGISRPSLREALRALSTLGVIETRHGGGAYVSDLEARTLLAPLDFFLSLTQSNINDAFDSRRVIEIEIARRAARDATRADIKELGEIVAAHATVQDDPVGFRILDTRFHEKLSAIADNAVLQRLAYALYNLGMDFQNFDRRARTDPGLISQSTADHAAVAEAVKNHDPDGAAQAIAKHIRHIELSTIRVIGGKTAARKTAAKKAQAASKTARRARSRS